MSKAAQRKKRPARKTRPNAPAPDVEQQGPQLSAQQVAEGLAAVLEVCSGAPQHRCLELGPKIEIGKATIREILGGNLQLGPAGKKGPQK